MSPSICCHTKVLQKDFSSATLKTSYCQFVQKAKALFLSCSPNHFSLSNIHKWWHKPLHKILYQWYILWHPDNTHIFIQWVCESKYTRQYLSDHLSFKCVPILIIVKTLNQVILCVQVYDSHDVSSKLTIELSIRNPDYVATVVNSAPPTCGIRPTAQWHAHV